MTAVILLPMFPIIDYLGCTQNTRVQNVFSMVLNPIRTILWQSLKIMQQFWSSTICIPIRFINRWSDGIYFLFYLLNCKLCFGHHREMEETDVRTLSEAIAGIIRTTESFLCFFPYLDCWLLCHLWLNDCRVRNNLSKKLIFNPNILLGLYFYYSANLCLPPRRPTEFISDRRKPRSFNPSFNNGPRNLAKRVKMPLCLEPPFHKSRQLI